MEIMEFFNALNENLNTFLMNAGMWAPLLSSLLIILESTFAFLPMFVFVTINVLTLGTTIGCFVSWICTTVGCFITFFLCRIGLSPLFNRLLTNTVHLNKFMNMINNMPFSRLVLIISIPLTPSFFVNLAAGLSKIPKKEYFYALLLGKTTIVIFWGILGSSIVDCLTNPIVLIKVAFLVIASNFIGKFFNKKFDLDEVFDETNK